ncbi:MAG: hypothetical protein F7C35_02480 [Desulfurococcales archaeon]|nr:hypothetical protein [Desulfurococcales archaeon]
MTGKVTVTATAPSVSFTLYSDSGYTSPTKEITPQTPVYMKISVSGDNPLEEATITVKMFADNNAAGVGTPPSSTSPETYVTFTISYDSGTGDWVLTADTGGSTTWSIQLDPNQQQADPTSSSGDFYVVITFGKTAREADPTGNEAAPYADWDIIVEATIGSGSLQASGSASDYGYTVYFYSEITADMVEVNFGTITASSSSIIQEVKDSGGTTHSWHSFNVTVIANGDYDLLATTDSSWTNQSTGHTITLTTGTPGDGQFKLEVDDQEDTTNPGTPLNPVAVTSDPTTASPFVDNALPTTESGATTQIFMRITLGSNIYTGLYTGTITIHAVDGG